MRDVTIVMDTTRGRPAEILDGLEAQGVDIVAGCLYPRLEGRVVHVTVDDHQVDAVRSVASAHGASVLDEREVIVVPKGQVRSPAQIARMISDAGAMVYVAYFGANGEVVIGTSDLDVARRALGMRTA